jgi:hypothetical protein
MATYTTEQFPLQKDSYVAFDAMSLRQLIVNRLNEQKVFTDQNFLGSNLASIIDIVAYSYNTLIYYLNKTSSESMFSEAQLYENINRIVKLIDYSPIGFQTSTLSFNCSAKNLPQGLYTIPRYSYIFVNNIPFSFNEDITFIKTTNTTESLNEIAQQRLLYQGFYQEYPVYTAAGEDNEIVILNPGTDIVDHFNIDVYVKPKLTNKWEVFTKTPNLFLEGSSEKKYEIRLNSNKRYEIKFGNDINGVKIQTGDQVAIYYLTSQGQAGEIGPNALNPTSDNLIRYNTLLLNEIIEDVFEDQFRYLTTTEIKELAFENKVSSTPVKLAEDADDIRKTAPANYRSQYRLVTTNDYEVFVKTNFTNLLADVKCVNNWDYISGYLKYFYDIGIKDPSKTERALFNQVQYADSCNFNNVYLLVVPRSASQNFDYVVPAQKELINSSILTSKMATAETVFIDPIYKAISIGISSSTLAIDPITDEELCRLEVIKRTSSRRDNQSIINDIVNIFTQYFSRDNIKLGQTIDSRSLTQQILDVDGVETFFTTRTDDSTVRIEGLSLFIWNPIYPDNDKTATTNNIPLKYFEYPFFNNLSSLSNKIVIRAVSTVFENIEY